MLTSSLFAIGFFTSFWSLRFAQSYLFGYCSPIVYDSQNEIDVEAMLYNCSSNIRGSMFPPSLFNGNKSSKPKSLEPTTVHVSLAINTVVGIDVAATVTLDLWFRQYWKDPRWNFPSEMWDSLVPAADSEGLELMPYIRTQNALGFWLPDTYILEQTSNDIQAEMVHLFRDGAVWWSRHCVLTIKQGQFDLKQYPLDTQTFTVTLQSWAYATQYVVLRNFSQGEGPPLVSLNTDPTLNNKEYIDLDPLWTYKGVNWVVQDQQIPSFFDAHRNYSTISIYFHFERISYGIIFRLALPILMFLLLVGAAFWSDISHRVDVTITMLLAVSAFYLIIGQVIPFVGYLSTLDRFITTAFFILAGTAGIHYMTNNLDTEKYKYPFNEFLRDTIVFLSRTLWVPFIIIVGIRFFKNSILESGSAVIVFVLIIMLLITSVSTLLHWEDLDIVFRKCLCQLRVKHYYKELDKPFLHACEDENMIQGENLVTIDLTSFEVCIYSFTTYFHVECACERKIGREKEKYKQKNIKEEWESFISNKIDDEEDEDGKSDNDVENGGIGEGYEHSYPTNSNRPTLNHVVPQTIEENKPFEPSSPQNYIPLSNLSQDGLEKNQKEFLRPSPLTIQNPNGEQLSFSVRKTTKILPNGTTIIDEEQFFNPSPVAKKKSFIHSFFGKPGDERAAAVSWFFHSSPHVNKQLSKDHEFFCQHVNIAIDAIQKMVKDHKAQLNQYHPLAHLTNDSNYIYKGSCDNRLCYRCNKRLNRSFCPDIYLNFSLSSLFSFKQKLLAKRNKKQVKKGDEKSQEIEE